MLKGSTPLWDRAWLRARARNLQIKLQCFFLVLFGVKYVQRKKSNMNIPICDDVTQQRH